MRKVMLASTMSLLFGISAAGHASAQITPNPTVVNIQGTVALSQSTTLNCNFNMTASINAGGTTGNVTSFTLSTGDTGCGSIVAPDSFNWPVTYVGPGQLRITGVSSTTLFGRCDGGTINVSWPGASPSGAVSFTTGGYTIPGYTVIPWNPNAPCSVAGSGVVTSSTGGLPVSVS